MKPGNRHFMHGANSCREIWEMITHEMKVVKEICTDVAVIHEARIVENGPVESVFIRHQSEIARQFISTVFPNKLPADLLKELSTHRDSEIVSIQFLGSRASDPIITDLLRTCDVQATPRQTMGWLSILFKAILTLNLAINSEVKYV